MPCNSVASDLDDAKEVSKTFDVRMLELDLSNSFNLYKKEINIAMGDNDLSKEALVNIKPRLRMTALYAIAQSFRIFSTWNTEIFQNQWFGYTTKWGDSGYDLNPIANFTVEEVLKIRKNSGSTRKDTKKSTK